MGVGEGGLQGAGGDVQVAELRVASLTWACPVVTQARKWLSRSWAWCSSGCGSGAVTALLSGWVPPGPIGLRSLVGELVRGGAVAAEAWG